MTYVGERVKTVLVAMSTLFLRKRSKLKSKTLLCLVILASLVIAMVPFAYAGPTTFYFDPASITGPPPGVGETFTVTIRVDEVPDLYWWVMDISWDPTIFDLVKVDEGGAIPHCYLFAEMIEDGFIDNLLCMNVYMEEVSVPPNPNDLVHLTFLVEDFTFGTEISMPWAVWINLGGDEKTPALAPLHFELLPPVHDVAITDVTSWKTIVGQIFSCQVNVTVANEGDFTETFDVTLYADTIVIGTETVNDLPNGTSTVLTFMWDATGFAKGSYTITAEADQVPGETDLDDNMCEDGTVIVAMPCDIAGSTTTPPAPPDGEVDYKDVFWLLKAYGSDPSKPNWDPNLDFAGSTTTPPAPPDGEVDYKDVYWMLKYYGKTDP